MGQRLLQYLRRTALLEDDFASEVQSPRLENLSARIVELGRAALGGPFASAVKGKRKRKRAG